MSEKEQEMAEAERARLERVLSSPRGNNQVNKVALPKEEPTSPRKEVASPRKYCNHLFFFPYHLFFVFCIFSFYYF